MSRARLEAPCPGAAASARYAILTMGPVRLLIPQNQVYALEPSTDVVHPAGGELAWIDVADGRWPVCCLSDDLCLVPEIPPGRNICVLLHTDDGLVGVLCDQVALLGQQAEVDWLPVPECMRTPRSPLQGLALQGERVLCVVSAQDLLAGIGTAEQSAGLAAGWEGKQWGTR